MADHIAPGSRRPAALMPPLARKIPRIDVVHGDRRQDDYSWLRAKDDPEVVAYLTAENAYTDAVMGPTATLQQALYQEMLARIKEDDQTVPYRLGVWLYYSRSKKGKQYPIHCRKRGSVEAAEEVVLDLNQLAEGHAFCALGVFVVSDDGRRLAYSVDFTGFRDYTLYVKDLVSGALEPEAITNVATAAWSADPAVFFYVAEDHDKRPWRLWRHRLGASQADEFLLEEPDELFRLHVWRSRSRALVFAGSASFTTTEVRYLPAAD